MFKNKDNQLLFLIFRVLFALLLIFIGINALAYLFIYKGLDFLMGTNDILNITNIGFAAFLGLASICFTWSSALRSERHIPFINNFNRAGADCVVTSLIFLLASFSRYCFKDLTEDKLSLHQKILKISSPVLFVIAIIIACTVLLRILLNYFVLISLPSEQELTKKKDK